MQTFCRLLLLLTQTLTSWEGVSVSVFFFFFIYLYLSLAAVDGARHDAVLHSLQQLFKTMCVFLWRGWVLQCVFISWNFSAGFVSDGRFSENQVYLQRETRNSSCSHRKESEISQLSLNAPQQETQTWSPICDHTWCVCCHVFNIQQRRSDACFLFSLRFVRMNHLALELFLSSYWSEDRLETKQFKTSHKSCKHGFNELGAIKIWFWLTFKSSK